MLPVVMSAIFPTASASSGSRSSPVSSTAMPEGPDSGRNDGRDRHRHRRGLQPKGVGVVIEAEHSCMTLRGVNSPSSSPSTSQPIGLVREEIQGRARSSCASPGEGSRRPPQREPFPPTPIQRISAGGRASDREDLMLFLCAYHSGAAAVGGRFHAGGAASGSRRAMGPVPGPRSLGGARAGADLFLQSAGCWRNPQLALIILVITALGGFSLPPSISGTSRALAGRIIHAFAAVIGVLVLAGATFQLI